MTKIAGYESYACRTCWSLHVRPHRVTFHLTSVKSSSNFLNPFGYCTVCKQLYDFNDFSFLGIRPSTRKVDTSLDKNKLYVTFRRCLNPNFCYKEIHILDEFPLLDFM